MTDNPNFLKTTEHHCIAMIYLGDADSTNPGEPDPKIIMNLSSDEINCLKMNLALNQNDPGFGTSVDVERLKEINKTLQHADLRSRFSNAPLIVIHTDEELELETLTKILKSKQTDGTLAEFISMAKF